MSRAPITADELIARLELQPHPEGGFYREVFRAADPAGGRGVLTSIYYLLRAGDVSAWHRLNDAVEIWHHQAGASLSLALSSDGRTTTEHRLGLDLAAGDAPQVVIPARTWQSGRSLGDWTLAGCAVAPAFEFSAFELAPVGWRPGEAGE